MSVFETVNNKWLEHCKEERHEARWEQSSPHIVPRRQKNENNSYDQKIFSVVRGVKRIHLRQNDGPPKLVLPFQTAFKFFVKELNMKKNDDTRAVFNRKFRAKYTGLREEDLLWMHRCVQRVEKDLRKTLEDQDSDADDQISGLHSQISAEERQISNAENADEYGAEEDEEDERDVAAATPQRIMNAQNITALRAPSIPESQDQPPSTSAPPRAPTKGTRFKPKAPVGPRNSFANAHRAITQPVFVLPPGSTLPPGPASLPPRPPAPEFNLFDVSSFHHAWYETIGQSWKLKIRK